jgi:hypothetical protein
LTAMTMQAAWVRNLRICISLPAAGYLFSPGVPDTSRVGDRHGGDGVLHVVEIAGQRLGEALRPVLADRLIGEGDRVVLAGAALERPERYLPPKQVGLPFQALFRRSDVLPIVADAFGQLLQGLRVYPGIPFGFPSAAFLAGDLGGGIFPPPLRLRVIERFLCPRGCASRSGKPPCRRSTLVPPQVRLRITTAANLSSIRSRTIENLLPIRFTPRGLPP